LGKLENCIVTVHLGYAVEDFHCLLDGELFVPENWAADRQRCREAGIPDTMAYRPKWRIALELYDRARANGLQFDRLTFDEGYGGKPELLRELSARQQNYVAEVPRSFSGWLQAPRVVSRPYHRGRRGRGRAIPRLASGSRPARRVEVLLNDRTLRAQPWQPWRVKDGDKGPLVWECKHTFLTIQDANGLPGARLHLLIARNVLNPDEVKFFVSNAPPRTGVGTLLLVAFSRWRVERCFEDTKSAIGLDQYEGRRYRGLKRHLLLSAVSFLFLARVRQEWGEKPGVDRVPAPYRDSSAGAILVGEWPGGLGPAAGEDRGEDQTPATAQRPGAEEPHQDHAPETERAGHTINRLATMQLGTNLAL
jgi:SRSO17 transposase